MKPEIISNPHPPETEGITFIEMREIVHAYSLLNPYYRTELKERLADYITLQKLWTARGFTEWDTLRKYRDGEIGEDPRNPYR